MTMLCAVCAELLCPLCATPAAPAATKKKRFKSTTLPLDIDKLLLDYISQLKSIISELTTRHPLLPNITDTAGFVESFSRLSLHDKNTSDAEEHLVRHCTVFCPLCLHRFDMIKLDHYLYVDNTVVLNHYYSTAQS